MTPLARKILAAAALSLALPGLQAAACPAHPTAAKAPMPALGLAITTEVPVARALFEAGLTAYWAGDAAAALHAFRAAQAADPACAMCHWGEALALGPRPQAPMPAAHVRPAWEAVLRAEAQAANAGPLERELIAALRHRYGVSPMVLRDALDHAWATALERVAEGAGSADLPRLLLGEAQAILRAHAPRAEG
jgi:hypothetical protein